MITQASGLVAQAGANYFDGASKLALASKSVLLKNMTEKFAAEDIKGGVEDALGIRRAGDLDYRSTGRHRRGGGRGGRRYGRRSRTYCFG
ncbi:hypothetical protein [Chromobacterium piscinae]|uniref:hypothetical protein n=1 Tax=Chromobacterium piscinae TaxID=686831 RepID=UPI0031FC1EC5